MSATSTRPQLGRWLGRLLSGRPHQTIRTDGGDPYLLRWHLIPRNRRLNIYLHKFLRSDEDRALHDHPWWFVSWIIRGQYLEYQYSEQPGLWVIHCQPRSRWSWAYRPAETRHRVQLIDHKPVWTVVLTGPKVRDWGFWCHPTLTRPARFVPWQWWDVSPGCGED